jgi:hypothetical protein
MGSPEGKNRNSLWDDGEVVEWMPGEGIWGVIKRREYKKKRR